MSDLALLNILNQRLGAAGAEVASLAGRVAQGILPLGVAMGIFGTVIKGAL